MSSQDQFGVDLNSPFILNVDKLMAFSIDPMG
jgi:hypothetical protein